MMFRQIILTALWTGFLAGTLFTGIQSISTLPIIHDAEAYEGGTLIDYTHHRKFTFSPVSHEDQADAWFPSNGAERLFFTFVANCVLATGFAFLLSAVYLYINNLTLRKGFVAGIIGYLTFFVLPSLGLTPEVPGTLAASLASRQLWWIVTVGASALGFAVLFFTHDIRYRVLAILLILAPHIVGAPHPEYDGGTAPISLFYSFVQASYISNGVFWLIIGMVSAALFRKFSTQSF